MKFGKVLQNHLLETIPEWRNKFLCYKTLKQLLKPFYGAVDFQPDVLPVSSIAVGLLDDCSGNGNMSSVHLQARFISILNEELDKFNDFYVDKEEEFVIRFKVLLFFVVDF